MKAKNSISVVLLFLFVCMAASADVYGQANSGKAVFHFGGSFSVPMGVTIYEDAEETISRDASNGFFGGDLFAGKMFTNELCLGFSAGFDMVHYKTFDVIDDVTQEPVKFNERLAVIPFLVKAKYYFSFSTMLQSYVGVGAGVYRALPSMGGHEIGTINNACNSPGGSISIGLDYWFLLTTGVGFEFEYHMFKVPDGGDMFKYWQVRVDYGLIKF